MQQTILSVFCTETASSGNPAIVVQDFQGTEAEQQQLAKKLNFPVTVFVDEGAAIPVLRFFYPDCEMPLCIHGALAAGFLLMQKYQESAMKALTVDKKELNFITYDGKAIYLAFDRGTKIFTPINKEYVNKMLNLEIETCLEAALPFCIASIGSPKLLIPLDRLETLASLKPNFDYIKQWSLQNKVNGLYVYTNDVQSKKYNYIARGFNPKGGKNEDAATGVAAGALYEALNITSEINISQGEFLGSRSCINVCNKDHELFIGGVIARKSLA